MDKLFSVERKVALVIGASSGIGECLARALAERGAKVVIAARRRDLLNKIVDDLTAAGHQVAACEIDVTNTASVEAAFDFVEGQYGVVEVLINSAGANAIAPVQSMTDEQWNTVLDVNLNGIWRACRSAMRRLIDAGKAGSLINISSILGIQARGLMMANYSTSKAATIHLTRNMALEGIEHGVRVNTIAPGYFRTELTGWYFDKEENRAEVEALPPGRLGQLDELVGPMLLLASDASSYMSGSVLVVDAGHSVRLG